MFSTDIRTVIRQLLRRPLYVLSVVAVLSMNIGAVVAIAGWIDALLLSPLPAARPETLITAQRSFETDGFPGRSASMNWSQVDRVLSIEPLRDVSITTTHEDLLSRRVEIRTDRRSSHQPVRFVSANYFSVLGVAAVQGRAFVLSDEAPQSDAVTVITHAYWQSEFGADPAVIGRAIQLNGVSAVIVGVLPRGFFGIERGGFDPALFLPLRVAPVVGRASIASGDLHALEPSDDGSLPPFSPAASFQIFARRPGAMEAVEAELIARLRSDRWELLPLAETVLPFASRSDLAKFLTLLALAGSVTLAIGCFQVGVLLRGRLRERAGELAIRASLGAPLGRIVRLVAVEVLLLGSASAICAIGVAAAIGRTFAGAALPGGVSLGGVVSDSSWSALLTLTTVICVALVVGTIPVAKIGSRQLVQAIHPVGRSWSGIGASRVLAVAQVAGSVTLAITASFFLRTVWFGMGAELGFNPSGLVQVNFGLSPEHRSNGLATGERLVSLLEQQAGIDVAAIGPAPLVRSADESLRKVHVDGRPLTLPESIDVIYVSTGYFRTLQQDKIRGRDFSPDDRASEGRVGLVTILNETAARLLWAQNSPLGGELTLDRKVFAIGPPPAGERARCRYPDRDSTPICNHPVEIATARVVGVVPDVMMWKFGEDERPAVYLPVSQWGARASVTGIVPIVARSSLSARTLSTVLGDVGESLGLSVEATTAVVAARDEMLRPQALARTLLVILAMVVGLVTLVGIYAATYASAITEERSNCVRLALGAQPRRLVLQVLWRRVSTITIGIGGGCLAAWWIRPVVEPMGFGVSLFDPVPLALTLGLVLLCAALAAWIPSRRILTLSPAALLR